MNTSIFKALDSCITSHKNIIKCFKSLTLIKPITDESSTWQTILWKQWSLNCAFVALT